MTGFLQRRQGGGGDRAGGGNRPGGVRAHGGRRGFRSARMADEYVALYGQQLGER
ncbi:hypothetical protein AB5I41_13440 [Sphingomonas sp. MMS24-JH45]